NALRLKPVLDELRAREANGRRTGWIGGSAEADAGDGAHILLIEHSAGEARAGEAALGGGDGGFVLEARALAPVAADLIIVSIAREDRDGLRIIAHIRAEETTRRLAVLAIANQGDVSRAMRALDLGADDLVSLPLDPDELRARVRTLMRRKRHLEAISA